MERFEAIEARLAELEGRLGEMELRVIRAMTTQPKSPPPRRHKRSSPSRQTARSSSPHRKPWVTVNQYLAVESSRGPEERVEGEATRHDQFDADILTLLALLRASDGPLRKLACIPNFRLCIYTSGRGEVLMRRSVAQRCPAAPRGYQLKLDVRAGVVVTGAGLSMKLWLPTRFREELAECRKQGKRFAVANFGLHSDSMADGHANALVFDLEHRLIERFDPNGRGVFDPHDTSIERLFLSRLPGWEYVGTRAAAPVRGVQMRADAFQGLCVTYSFMYILLRLLNPDRTPLEINHFMARGSKRDLRQRVLRLNRFMMDTLRAYPRGSLRHL